MTEKARLQEPIASPDFLGVIVKTAEQNKRVNPGDYQKGGLLYCGNCHTPKQAVIHYLGHERIVPALCDCAAEKVEKRQAEEEKKRAIAALGRLKTAGIQDKNIRDWTFANDDGKNAKVMRIARQYVAKWETAYLENIGLLLYGGVGTGKTYFAACIANALLDQGVPVLVTNMPKIIHAVSGMYGEDKNAYIQSFARYKLLVIDDFGVERQSEYATEQVYNVIDARYRNHQPLIVTTNIPYTQIENPTGMATDRIYDRIKEMCVPVMVTGASRRAALHAGKVDKARRLFIE